MKADQLHTTYSREHWAVVKKFSEFAGYTVRDQQPGMKTYSDGDLREFMAHFDLTPSPIYYDTVLPYMNARAEMLNALFPQFMNKNEAKFEYESLRQANNPTLPVILNKQKKGEPREPLYLTNIVAIIAEKVTGATGFVHDPQKLAYVTKDGRMVATFSRRFDGVVPNVRNPALVWECKEYYGSTTFGSRVAGGVYETVLDGYEISEALEDRPAHFLFVDDRHTWWKQGRSYLCRMVDALHQGHVTEIFFGREVLTDWESTLRRCLQAF